MKDIEGRLRDLGERIRAEQGPPALEPRSLRRVKRRRLATATTGLLVVAALISVGTYALGALNEEPAPLPPAQHENAEDAEVEVEVEVDKRICKRQVDFEPSYVLDGWIQELQEGSGGGNLEPPRSAPYRVVGHYGNDAQPGTREKARGGFAELYAGESPFPVVDGEDILVLDEPAVLGAIHEGYAVEFTQHDCDYALLAYGITRQELRDLAEGLRLPGERVEPQPARKIPPKWFAAVWPEDTYKAAKGACDRDSGAGEVGRSDPKSIALAFGERVLGWQTPSVVDSEERYGREIAYELRRDGRRRPAVLVFPVEVVPDCWSIASVSRVPEEEARYDESDGAMMSVRGGNVMMFFADMKDAATAVLEVGYGGEATRYVWRNGEGTAEFALDFDPRGKGHFLVLLMDADGEVFSAFGSSLPAGDFAAG